MIIVEPNDSVMIRLNTHDFDKSLVFTGNGSHKNNYLLKTYNQNIANNRKLVKHSQKEPEEFQAFVNDRHKKQLLAVVFLGKSSDLADEELLDIDFFETLTNIIIVIVTIRIRSSP